MIIYKRKKEILITLAIVISAVAFAIVMIISSKFDGNADVKHITDEDEPYIGEVWIDGNPDDFYGYENGILVPGKCFDDYKAAMVASGKMTEEESENIEINELVDANFNHEEWIKKCDILVKDADNNILIKDRAGVRISGNASKKLCQKSFCIIADDEYGTTKKYFNINLGDRSPDFSKELRIHSCGQDLRKTQLKEEFINALARRCGIKPVRDTMPVLIYINEQFYGVGHLENRIDNAYIAACYGINDNGIERYEGGIEGMLEHLGYSAEEDYDFSDEQLRTDFESKVDVEDFIQYVAFNLAIANTDWPQNNIVMWRYNGGEIDGIPETDGKYRFIISDVDVAFMGAERDDPFAALNWQDGSKYLEFISQLTEYIEYRDIFVNNMMDIAAMAFDEEIILGELSKLVTTYGNAFTYAAEHSTDETQLSYLQKHDEALAELALIARERRSHLYDALYMNYETGAGYYLTVEPPDEGVIIFSTVQIKEGEAAVCSLRSAGCDVPIKAFDKKGRPAAGYIVNNEYVPAIDGVISLPPAASENANIVVRAVFD